MDKLPLLPLIAELCIPVLMLIFIWVLDIILKRLMDIVEINSQQLELFNKIMEKHSEQRD